jgi:PQQ-dependent catabolism-associated CXXCW motif protein
MRAGLGAALVVLAVAARAEGPPEPAGYRMDAYRAPTPRTLAGAVVIDTAQAEALWRAGEAVFIDVMPRRVRPATLPEGTIWRDRPRDSIPGAVWFANAGYGAIAAPLEARFRAALTALDGARGLVFFCLRDCWMSWNAAKRALSLKFERVYWYPDGVDGWEAAGLPLERVMPAEGF